MVTPDNAAVRGRGSEGLTPAQLWSLVFGAVLLLVGIVGFFVNSSFDTGSPPPNEDLIIFPVNAWENVVHIGSGALGLLMWKSNATARLYAIGLGAVYAVVTLLGFVTGDHVLQILPVDINGNILHLLIAVTGILAGLASPSARGSRGAAVAPR